MNLAEATKKLRAEKAREHYMSFTIDGSCILPHKAGVALLEAMGQAEKAPNYQNNYSISSLDRHAVQSSLLTHQDYDRFKLAALMNVRYEDIVEAERLAKENQITP